MLLKFRNMFTCTRNTFNLVLTIFHDHLTICVCVIHLYKKFKLCDCVTPCGVVKLYMKYSFISFHNSPLDGVQSLVRSLQLKRLKLVNLIDLRWATCHQIISAGWFIEVSNSLSFCVCCTYLNFPDNWKKQVVVGFRDQVEHDQDEELEQHQCFY